MTRRDANRGLPDEIHTEGGLLSADFLERLGKAKPSGRGDKSIIGLTPADFHLADRDTLSDAMARTWNELRGHWQGFAARLESDPQAATITTAATGNNASSVQSGTANGATAGLVPKIASRAFDPSATPTAICKRVDDAAVAHAVPDVR